MNLSSLVFKNVVDLAAKEFGRRTRMELSVDVTAADGASPDQIAQLRWR